MKGLNENCICSHESSDVSTDLKFPWSVIKERMKDQAKDLVRDLILESYSWRRRKTMNFVSKFFMGSRIRAWI